MLIKVSGSAPRREGRGLTTAINLVRTQDHRESSRLIYAVPDWHSSNRKLDRLRNLIIHAPSSARDKPQPTTAARRLSNIGRFRFATLVLLNIHI